MHETTKALIDGCRDAKDICPKKVGEPMLEFMGALRRAMAQVSEQRLHFATMQGFEDDPAMRAIAGELDQKLGAAEREARKLMDQAIRVQDIFRQFRDTEARVRSAAGKEEL